MDGAAGEHQRANVSRLRTFAVLLAASLTVLHARPARGQGYYQVDPDDGYPAPPPPPPSYQPYYPPPQVRYVQVQPAPPPVDESSSASLFSFDIRTVAALGFFPLGGNLAGLDEKELNTYVFGGACDLFNIQSSKIRITFLNITPYLVGFNWLALQSSDKSNFFNIGLLHVGPHFRVNAASLGRTNYVALGVQPGYAFVLKSDLAAGSTRYLHGFDLAATISWSPDNLVAVESKSKKMMGVAGFIALAGAGALMGAILPPEKSISDPLRVGLAAGGGSALLTAAIMGIASD